MHPPERIAPERNFCSSERGLPESTELWKLNKRPSGFTIRPSGLKNPNYACASVQRRFEGFEGFSWSLFKGKVTGFLGFHILDKNSLSKGLKIQEMKMEALSKITMNTFSAQISTVSMKIQG